MECIVASLCRYHPIFRRVSLRWRVMSVPSVGSPEHGSARLVHVEHVLAYPNYPRPVIHGLSERPNYTPYACGRPNYHPNAPKWSGQTRCASQNVGVVTVSIAKYQCRNFRHSRPFLDIVEGSLVNTPSRRSVTDRRPTGGGLVG